jgi:hypothetical protein
MPNKWPIFKEGQAGNKKMALVEVHWARRVQAPMPQVSGPNSQENHTIETCKEKETAAAEGMVGWKI